MIGVGIQGEDTSGSNFEIESEKVPVNQKGISSYNRLRKLLRWSLYRVYLVNY